VGSRGTAAAARHSCPFGEPAAAPRRGEASCQEKVEFTSNVLLVGIDDNRQPTYKAKGEQNAQFGVRIWPETCPPWAWNLPASPVPACTLPQAQVDGQSRVPQV